MSLMILLGLVWTVLPYRSFGNTRLDYFEVKENPQLQIFWAYLPVKHTGNLYYVAAVEFLINKSLDVKPLVPYLSRICQ